MPELDSLVSKIRSSEKVRRCETVDSTPRHVIAMTTLDGTAVKPQSVLWINPDYGSKGMTV